MSNIINYMQELGLTNLEVIKKYFMETDITTIIQFNEYVWELALKDWTKPEYTPYSFVPSIDLSGFGGCSEVDCKIERAHIFDKFASLYSDVVYLFVDSITTPHKIEISKSTELSYRHDLICDYSLIFIYSDLIKSRIARIVPPNFSLCQTCFAKHVLDEKEMFQLDPLVQDYSKKAVIEALDYNKKKKFGSIKISNLPELFPDHDIYMIINNDDDLDVLKTIKEFPSQIRDIAFVRRIVKHFIDSQYLTSKFEIFMSSTYQSKFITSKPSDKKMIDVFSKKVIGTTPASVFEMPFLKNIDTATILKLRDDEHHTFNDYRIALDKATKLYLDGQNSAEAKDIYDDIVYPAFIKLDAMLERTKKMRAFKTAGELIIVSSTVTLGVMNSIIPANPVGIATALGGTGILVKQLSDIIERKLLSKNELEAKDFYFLWQLKNKNN